MQLKFVNIHTNRLNKSCITIFRIMINYNIFYFTFGHLFAQYFYFNLKIGISFSR